MWIQVATVLEVDDGGSFRIVAPLTAREAFWKYLVAHSTEGHLEQHIYTFVKFFEYLSLASGSMIML